MKGFFREAKRFVTKSVRFFAYKNRKISLNNDRLANSKKRLGNVNEQAHQRYNKTYACIETLVEESGELVSLP